MANYTGRDVSSQILSEELDLRVDNASWEPSRVEVSEAEGVEGVTLLRHVFTRDECATIITHGFEAFEEETTHPVMWRKWADDPEAEERKCGRRHIFKAPEVAAMIYERVRAFLPPELETETQVARYRWAPDGMSPRLKFISYASKQGFPTHYDGPYVVDERHRSHVSVLLYLSDGGGGRLFDRRDHRGGELQFFEKEEEGALAPEVEVPIASVVPEVGMVVLMAHRLLHNSKPVERGKKYMVRGDAMYRVVEEVPRPQDS